MSHDKLAIRFISEIVYGELRRLGEKESTFEEFKTFIETLSKYGFVEEHRTFFIAVIKLGEEINERHIFS